MEFSDKIKKLSTGIYGLDKLFYGGIQLHWQLNDEIRSVNCESKVYCNQNKNIANGLIIVIRGARGLNKTLLALNLMQGLTKSLYQGGFEQKYLPRFYSLNKTKEDLSDMYLDLLISKQIERLISDYLNNKWKNSANPWLGSSFTSCFFRTEEGPSNHINCDTPSFPPNLMGRLDKYLSERTIYYNTRTNALHFKNNTGSDSLGNLLFYRKSHTVGDYINNGYWSKLPNDYQKDFVNAEFIGASSSEREDASRVYKKTSTIRLQEIIDTLANSALGKKENSYYPCVVIDGLSDISTLNLQNLPFTHIENTLRKVAPISILVFDDRYEDIKCDADIVIEMRRKEDDTEEYTYHELQISKSVFQTVAFGWHQYKKRDSGIEVFPSLHRILQKRYYLPHLTISTHKSILGESYGDFQRDMQYAKESNLNISYERFDSEKEKREYDLLKGMYLNNLKDSSEEEQKRQLECVLFGSKGDLQPCRWENHTYATAIIGNPNSYKRYIANAKAFNAAKEDEHTLIMLFDKDTGDMRKQMICPAFSKEMMTCADKNCNNNIYNCSNCSFICLFKTNCHNCYDYIHFFGVRMGCISAEELFAVLERQLDLKFENGKQIKHIIIDDLQKIDYSFPFLKNTTLFLSAMITFCRERNIELTILCDKKARLVNELCSLADNVICILRNKGDIDNIKLYLERSVYRRRQSEIIEYEIKNIWKLFKCEKDGKNLSILNKEWLNPRLIGSMKRYWRQSYNIYQKTEESDSANSENNESENEK